MRTYRRLWQAAVVLIVVLAVVLGGAQVGWASMAGAVAMLTALGAGLGAAWSEAGTRRQAALRYAGWSAAVGAVLVGLPAAVGGHARPVLLALALGSPMVLGWLVSLTGRGTGRGIGRGIGQGAGATGEAPGPDAAVLARRWEATSAQLHDPRIGSEELLHLVEERARLLEAYERVDPDGFALALDRAGWRGTTTIVD